MKHIRHYLIPKKEKGYDAQFFGNSEPVERVFKTFKLEPEEKTAESVFFVTYWNAYSSLNEILEKSLQLMNREEKKKVCRSDCSESLDGLNMKIHTAIVRSQKWPGGSPIYHFTENGRNPDGILE